MPVLENQHTIQVVQGLCTERHTPMNNYTLAKRWRQQEKKYATASNMYYVGNAIYSYGYHFPMACITPIERDGKAVVFINNDRYSVTTSKHQSYVYSVTYKDARIFVSTRLLTAVIDDINTHKTLTTDTSIAIYVELEKRLIQAEKKYQHARTRKHVWQSEKDAIVEQSQLLTRI